jgi:hypothetical protein
MHAELANSLAGFASLDSIPPASKFSSKLLMSTSGVDAHASAACAASERCDCGGDPWDAREEGTDLQKEDLSKPGLDT